MIEVLTRRRLRRVAAIGLVARELSRVTAAHKSRRRDDDTVWDLVELRDTLTGSLRHLRRGSLAAVLMRDAHLWITTWLDQWELGHLPSPHLDALLRQMLEHLARIAARMSTVVERQACRTRPSDWPSVEPDGGPQPGLPGAKR